MPEALNRLGDARPGRYLVQAGGEVYKIDEVREDGCLVATVLWSDGEGFLPAVLRPSVVEDWLTRGAEFSDVFLPRFLRPRPFPEWTSPLGYTLRARTPAEMVEKLERERRFYRNVRGRESCPGGWDAALARLEAEISRWNGEGVPHG